MFTFFKYEFKANIKGLMIWALSVGGMGLICILLYKGMQENMADMAESFASMGAFSDAFGMSALSIATLKGYFATEIGTIHALGSGMFAASIATVALSKEEDQHTTDFTFSLPLSREKIVAIKMLGVFVNIILFTGICAVMYEIGFAALGENPGNEFVEYIGFQIMMNVEIAAMCFVISAISKKNKLGVGISVAMVMYVYDLMGRVIPDLKKVIFISPYSYSNATSIFSGSEIDIAAIILGIFVIAITAGFSFVYYVKRDLAS